jgi:hypothetical protein
MLNQTLICEIVPVEGSQPVPASATSSAVAVVDAA